MCVCVYHLVPSCSVVWYHTDLQRMDVQEHLSQGGVRKMVEGADRMSPILRSLARLSTIKCALPTIAAHFEIETIIYHNLSNIWVFSQGLPEAVHMSRNDGYHRLYQKQTNQIVFHIDTFPIRVKI